MRNQISDKTINAELLLIEAKTQIKLGQLPDAEKYLIDSLKEKPLSEAYCTLGIIKYQKGLVRKAIKDLQAAVKIDAQNHYAHATLMRIFYEQKKISPAFKHACLAMISAPENVDYKSEFVGIANELRIASLNVNVKKSIELCFRDKDFNPEGIKSLWFNYLRADPNLYSLYKLRKHQNYSSFEKEISKIKNFNAFHSTYFLKGLQEFVIADMTFENFLTNLRHFILKDAILNVGLFSYQDHSDFLQALSIYCFHTDYIIYVTEDENELLSILHQRIDNNLDVTSAKYDILLLSMYEYVHKHSHADFFAKAFTSEKNLQKFLECHLLDPLDINDIKTEISSLTELNDATSADVKKQYEEFPYPSWRYLPSPEENNVLEHFDLKQNIKILIAGCGTGYEAALISQALTNKGVLSTEILAVDLSYSSLAYAIFQSRKLKLDNITFRQADILELDKALTDKFDIIFATGVLHHMKDPLAGLDVLLKLLKPNGLIQISLYSALARRNHIIAQNLIKNLGFKDDINDIRSFRKKAGKIMDSKALKGLMQTIDYFVASPCRDLIFHVMEHCYTIPEISKIIEARHLKVMTLETNGPKIVKYCTSNPDDPQRSNLQKWHVYELKNPDTFRKMYKLLLQKPE